MSATADEHASGRRSGVVLGMAAIAVVVAAAVAVALSASGDDGPAAPPPTTNGITVAVPAGTSIQDVVDANPPGTTFLLEAGTYRAQQVTPRGGDVFRGVGPATVLNGAVVVDGWQRTGRTWSVSGFTSAGPAHGDCRPEAPRCDRPDELFLDGRRLTHVGAIDDVTSGTWWFDYDTGELHLADDPTGHTLELATAPFAFDGDAAGVVVSDLTVTHFATPAQRGAINALGDDWLIERVVAEDNHALGIYLKGDRTVVRDSVARANGQLGLGANGSADAVVDRVELADNNQIGFNDEWEGGGAKFTLTDGLRFTNSFVHGNDGAGIWFDESAQDSFIGDNRSIDNTGAGIFYEISKGATITGNTVTGNGFGERSRGWLWGAGILIAASWDVTVTDNQVAGNHNGVAVIQQDRGSGPLGPRLADDIEVSRNTIAMDEGQTGAVSDVGGAVFGRSISFRDNTYDIPPGSLSFAWDGEDLDADGWAAAGQS